MARFGVISSRDNPQIKRAAKLAASSRSRRENGLFVVEGVRLCLDALRSGLPVETLFYTAAGQRRYPEAVEELKGAAAAAFETDPAVFAKLSDTATPQGLICLCPIPERPEGTAVDPRGKYAALEHIADPANLGTMARTAEALGLDGLLLSPDCCDPYSPKVLRAGMGALFRTRLFPADDFCGTLAALRERGMSLYAALPRRDARPVTQVRFGPGAVILIGNEGGGLTEEAVALSQPVTIPMGGRAESLNAAAAAAILMWEMLR
ncbi:MAG: RNA methyltransferase [Clostridiales bacterium]|nr:RNA methyltransferase [Clostridiales bacterium]